MCLFYYRTWQYGQLTTHWEDLSWPLTEDKPTPHFAINKAKIAMVMIVLAVHIAEMGLICSIMYKCVTNLLQYCSYDIIPLE
jgi:hypothetical protein